MPSPPTHLDRITAYFDACGTGTAADMTHTDTLLASKPTTVGEFRHALNVGIADTWIFSGKTQVDLDGFVPGARTIHTYPTLTSYIGITIEGEPMARASQHEIDGVRITKVTVNWIEVSRTGAEVQLVAHVEGDCAIHALLARFVADEWAVAR